MAIRSTTSSTPWLANRIRFLGTDAQNVELEAYAEELEAAEASSALQGVKPLPGYMDLLETSGIMIEICELMLRDSNLSDDREGFLTSLESQMTEIYGQIEAQISPRLPLKSGKTKA